MPSFSECSPLSDVKKMIAPHKRMIHDTTFRAKCNSFFSELLGFFVDSRQFHPKVGDQKPEYPPDNRDSGHFLQGIGVSCHLPPVPLASLGQMLGGDMVRLEIHQGDPLRRLKPAVDHPLEQDLLPRRRLGKEAAGLGQDRERILRCRFRLPRSCLPRSPAKNRATAAGSTAWAWASVR